MHQKKPNGILFHRFMSPKNRLGVKKRLYVQCPPEFNNTAFLKQLEREAIERHMSGMFTTSDTFASYVRERFLKEYPAAKNLRASSRDTLIYLFEKLVLPELGKQPLGAVDAGTVARFVATLRARTKMMKGEIQRGYSDRTIRMTVMAISSVLRWATKLGDLAGCPSIPVPRVSQAQRPEPYSSAEAQRLIGAARDDEERAIFLLIYDTGMRKGEILGLEKEQLSFEGHTILIDRQFSKGQKAKTKSGKARTVSMSPELETALKRIRNVRGSYVFSDKDGEPRSEAWLRWVFKRAQYKAGLRHNRIHDGRHAFSTRCSDAGMNAFTLRELLGHSDVRTTQGYVHPAPPVPPSVLGSAR